MYRNSSNRALIRQFLVNLTHNRGDKVNYLNNCSNNNKMENNYSNIILSNNLPVNDTKQKCDISQSFILD